MKSVFDNRQEFTTPFKHLKRYAGVFISEPMQGANGPFMDAQFSYPSFNEEAFGKYIKPEELEETKQNYTALVIEKLDERIKELETIKQNLLNSLK